MRLSTLEEGFLKQKSKIHWLRVGDGNNSFFHRSAQIRQMRNSIRELKGDNGEIYTNIADIKQEAVQHFEKMMNHMLANYKGCSTDELERLLSFRCSNIDREGLTATVTSEEIKKTLFEMPLNKAPGPDGYTVEFFKDTWPIVGKDVIAAIQSFFVKGFLPKGINSTILALIPKCESAMTIKDYMPISCCNVLYKVITKILSNRLRPILPKIILSNQSAFIQGRLLLENVLLASELVKDYHKENIYPRCTMKIDIAKAFDSVQWSFIITSMQALGFPSDFIHWIRMCITSPSFSVQVNGENAGYFGSARGLRQGCPLSPYLFVLCLNVLSHMLNESAIAGNMAYHPKCKNINLTHLCFADDLLVFIVGKKQSILSALQVFDSFSIISGLQINLQKSTIFSAGVKNDVLNVITEAYGISLGTLPVRYLGLPLMSNRMGKNDYQPLVEHIKLKLQSWTGRFLSYAGRLQLIKSVITSIITFWISAFSLPKRCTREINGLCSAFLWSGPELHTKKSKISWKEICKPTSEGGLGIRSIDDSIKVSNLKLIWILLSATSIWADWVHGYLLRKGSFWSLKSTTTMGSWIWKKLLKIRTLAMDFHRKKIGNGHTTSYWYDNWSRLGQFFGLVGERGSMELGIPLPATILDASKTHRSRQHRLHTYKQILTESASTFVNLNASTSDIHTWKLKEGIFKPRFSTKQTWEQIRVQSQKVSWEKTVWFKHSTPKYSFLVWLGIKGKLSTGDRMLAWSPSINAQCVFCGNALETRNHLFFECGYSKQTWVATCGSLLGNLNHYTWDSIIQSFSTMPTSTTPTIKFLLRYAFHSTVYHIWRERNDRRHTSDRKPHTLLIKLIDKNIRNRILSLPPRHKPDIRKDGLIQWFGSR